MKKNIRSNDSPEFRYQLHAEADEALRHAIKIDPDAEVVELIADSCPLLGNGQPITFHTD